MWERTYGVDSTGQVVACIPGVAAEWFCSGGAPDIGSGSV